MTARPILPLGDAALYEPSTPVDRDELAALADDVRDLHDTMLAFQRTHGWGRAIAAPQIGVARRFVAMRVDEPVTFFNPVLDEHDPEHVTYWEDCMCFPELLVQVRLPRACRITWQDEHWVTRRAWLTGDYAALLQHEVDHLDGRLATQRAVDGQSLALRASRPPKDLRWQGTFEPLAD